MRPYAGSWMSDHYGVLSTFSLAGPSDVPNPATDAEGAPLGPAEVVTVVDASFAPCADRKHCFLTDRGRSVQSLRGLALVNRTSGQLRAEITGPARVYPWASTALDAGQASSFVFLVSGRYVMTVEDERGDAIDVPLDVDL